MHMPRRSVTILLALGLLCVAFDLADVVAQAQPRPSKRAGRTCTAPTRSSRTGCSRCPTDDDGVKHEGWTFGSQAAVFAESPDRIWIAQRGELPVPKGAKSWTPYAQISPSPGAAPPARASGDALPPRHLRGRIATAR